MPLGASEITLEEATNRYLGPRHRHRRDSSAHEPDGRRRADPHVDVAVHQIRDAHGRVLERPKPEPTLSRREGRRDDGRHPAERRPPRRPADAGGGRGLAGEHPARWAGRQGRPRLQERSVRRVRPGAPPPATSSPAGSRSSPYVGYDDNRSMSKGKIKLAGASGALPALIGTASGLAAAGLLGEPPAIEATEEGWALLTDRGLARVTVDEKTGIPKPDGTASSLVRGSADSAEPALELPRLERPARIAPGTEEVATDGTSRPEARPEEPIRAPAARGGRFDPGARGPGGRGAAAGPGSGGRGDSVGRRPVSRDTKPASRGGRAGVSDGA